MEKQKRWRVSQLAVVERKARDRMTAKGHSFAFARGGNAPQTDAAASPDIVFASGAVFALLTDDCLGAGRARFRFVS